MAYKIIKPADRDAWLKEREKGIGSSEATTLMGVNHYEDRYRLFLRKTGQMAPKPASEQMELGHHLEPAVASRFADRGGHQEGLPPGVSRPHLGPCRAGAQEGELADP